MTVDGKDGPTRSPRRPQLSKEQILEHRLIRALHISTCRDIWSTKKSYDVKLGLLTEVQHATSYNHDAIDKGSEYRAILNPGGQCASGFADNPSRGDLHIIDADGKRTHSVEVKTQGQAQSLARPRNAEKYRGMTKVVESDNLPKNLMGKDIDQENIHPSIDLYGVQSEPFTSEDLVRRASCDWHKGVDLTDPEIAKKYGVPPELLQDVKEQGLMGKPGKLQKRIDQEVRDLGGKLPSQDPHYDGEHYNSVTQARPCGMAIHPRPNIFKAETARESNSWKTDVREEMATRRLSTPLWKRRTKARKKQPTRMKAG